MRPAFRLVALVVLTCLVGAGRAEAGIWDWIEELNGPGPSTGSSLPYMVNFFCKPSDSVRAQNQSKSVRLLRAAFKLPEDQPGKVSTCFYYDSHSFHANEDVNFYAVDSRLWEFGVTARLHPTLEIGGGLGRFSFNSRFPDSAGGNELRGGRLAVTFPRFVFKPLIAIPWDKTKGPEWGWLQLYFKHTILEGTLADEDFASKEGTEFFRNNQRVESVGITIDLTAIANLVAKRVSR